MAHYQILVVQADDQDFDVNLVARNPRALVDMEMVKARPGQRDMFKSLQSKYRARARNSLLLHSGPSFTPRLFDEDMSIHNNNS